MAVVVAAILAGFLAGAVALFREHRLQQRRLLVASRVTYDALGMATKGINGSLSTDKWDFFNALPGKASFSSTWETCKEDLAGHLSWPEWRHIENAVNHYLAAGTLSRDDPPSASHAMLDPTQEALEKGMAALHPYCTQRLSVWKLIQRRLRAYKQGEQSQ